MKRFEILEMAQSRIETFDQTNSRIRDNQSGVEAELLFRSSDDCKNFEIYIDRIDSKDIDSDSVIGSMKDMVQFALFGDNNELKDAKDKDRTTYWPKARYINNGGTISELFTRHGFVNVKAAEEQIFEWKKEFGFDICEAWIDVCGEKEYKNEYKSYCSEQNRIEVIRRYPR